MRRQTCADAYLLPTIHRALRHEDRQHRVAVNPRRVEGEDRVAQRNAQLLMTIHRTLREEDLQLQSSSLAFPYVCPEPPSVKSSFAQFTMRL